VGTNLRASASLRGAFLLQALFMLVNNFTFFTVWWIFFQRYPEIRGWKLPDLAALYGITAVSIGFLLVFGGGIRTMARMIADGELDPLLTQPKGVLLHLLGSSSRPSGWGDMISGVILIAYSGYAHGANVPLVLLLLCCSIVVFFGAAVMAQSLAFWLGPVDGFSWQLVEFVVTFSVYPQSVYPLYLKVLLFTLIPGGFISYLPVTLLREFNPWVLAAVVGAAAVYAALASAMFYRGLREYESGNRVGARSA
jgi:ABC-2 type transport system permease protein